MPAGRESRETTPLCDLACAGAAELRQPLLQVVAQQRQAEEVTGDAVVVLARSLGAQVLPLVDRAGAASDPCERHEIELLVHAQPADERGELVADGIVVI